MLVGIVYAMYSWPFCYNLQEINYYLESK
jgi:hypothetical protein